MKDNSFLIEINRSFLKNINDPLVVAGTNIDVMDLQLFDLRFSYFVYFLGKAPVLFSGLLLFFINRVDELDIIIWNFGNSLWF